MAINKMKYKIVASLITVVTMTISFFMIMILVLQSMIWWTTYNSPHDPSSGDGAAWVFIFSSPIWICIDVFVTMTVGVIVYTISYSKLASPRVEEKRTRG